MKLTVPPSVGGLPTMTDPQQMYAGAPSTGNASTADSELTAAASLSQPVHSDDATDGSNDDPHERLAATFGSDVDHTNNASLAFPGFRPLRFRLNDEATHFLLSDRRWCNQDDSERTVGQKNTIIIFVCMGTIEECLVDERSGKLLPVAEPFEALMDTLDLRCMPNGTHRSYKFISAIRAAFVRSRHGEIKRQMAIGNGWLPEPSGLSGLGKTLLDVVDSHIAFLRTRKPLTRLCVPVPLEKMLGLRLIQIKNQLRDKACIEKCFTTFIPTIPAHEKISWPRSGRATAENDARAEHNVEAPNAAVDPSRNESRTPDYKMNSEALRDCANASEENPCPNVPGNSVGGPARPSHPTPTSSAWQPDALSGLQLFKAAASQAHQLIRGSKDNTFIGGFINQIEEDVKEFQEALRPPTSPARTDSAGDPRPLIEVPLDPECIRSLMLIGLLLIHQKWNEDNVTDNSRQKILGDILEELYLIKEAADQVYTAQA